jgi:hypothetical protein
LELEHGRLEEHGRLDVAQVGKLEDGELGVVEVKVLELDVESEV